MSDEHVTPAKTGAQAPATATPEISAAAAKPSAWRIVRIGGESPEAIGAGMHEAMTDPARAYAAAEHSTFAPSDTLRLAIVADSPQSLSEKLQTAAKQLSNPAAHQESSTERSGRGLRAWHFCSRARDRSTRA
jgi:hypothetical protein